MGKAEAKVEKAEVEGLEEESKVYTEEERQKDVEELLKLVDVELSQEIGRQMRGIFDETGMYNIPKRSPSGQKVWNECDLMPGGCQYKNRENHVHIVDVNVRGAYYAMQNYGRLKIVKNEKPTIEEVDGKKYWVAHIAIEDGHNGNAVDLWYHEPAEKIYNGKVTKIEYGSQVAQSKLVRNIVLDLIPGDLRNDWKRKYREGKNPFTSQQLRKHTNSQVEAPENGNSNAELDSMTLLNDWLKQIADSQTLEQLQEVWTANWPGIKAHPALAQLTKAKDEKKAELPKNGNPAKQDTLFPETPTE